MAEFSIDDTIELLKLKYPNKGTLKGHFFQIKKLYSLYGREAPQEIERELDEIFKILNDQSSKEKYTLTDKEKASWMGLDEINLLKQQLEEQSKTDWFAFQKLLVLRLYTEIPPLRRDYCSVSIDSECENWLDLEKGEIILRNYKTDKTYGEKKVSLTPSLIKCINEWYAIRRDKCIASNYLLICKQGTGMVENTFTKFVSTISKEKKLTVNLLRKVYISLNSNFEYEDRMNIIADGMCHSRSTAQKYYMKKDERV